MALTALKLLNGFHNKPGQQQQATRTMPKPGEQIFPVETLFDRSFCLFVFFLLYHLLCNGIICTENSSKYFSGDKSLHISNVFIHIRKHFMLLSFRTWNMPSKIETILFCTVYRLCVSITSYQLPAMVHKQPPIRFNGNHYNWALSILSIEHDIKISIQRDQ